MPLRCRRKMRNPNQGLNHGVTEQPSWWRAGYGQPESRWTKSRSVAALGVSEEPSLGSELPSAPCAVSGMKWRRGALLTTVCNIWLVIWNKNENGETTETAKRSSVAGSEDEEMDESVEHRDLGPGKYSVWYLNGGYLPIAHLSKPIEVQHHEGALM